LNTDAQNQFRGDVDTDLWHGLLATEVIKQQCKTTEPAAVLH